MSAIVKDVPAIGVPGNARMKYGNPPM